MRRPRVRRAMLGPLVTFAVALGPGSAGAEAGPDQDDDRAPAQLLLVSQAYAVAADEAWVARFEVVDSAGSLAATIPPSSIPSPTSMPATATPATDPAATTGASDATTPTPPALTGAVVVGVHERVADRNELAEILAGELPPVTDRITVELGDVVVGPDGGLAVDLAVPTDTRRGGDGLTLTSPGVYPVTVTVRLDGGVRLTHRTFLRRLPSDTTGDPPLGIAIAAALGDPGPNPTAPVLDRHRAELEQLARYGTTTGAPLSLALPPSLDTVLDGDELLRAEVADALTHTELISLPLLTLDPSAAAAADQMGRFASEVREGEDTLARLFPGVAPRRSAWLVERPLSGPAAAALRDPLGYRLLILDQDRYRSLPGSIGGYLDTQRLIAASPGPAEQDVAAAVVDPNSDLLAGDDGRPLDAAIELLTRLLIARDEIGVTDRRTAVLALDDFALPDAATVEALATLVAAQPDIEMVTVSEVAARTDFMRVDDDITRVELPEGAGPELTQRLERIELVRVATESAASMLPTADRRTTWQRELDGLVSTGLSDEAVAATLDRITGEVDAVLASVEPPESFSFTLTGRRSELRINVRNNADDERLVRIRPSSPKLRFPDGDQVVELAPGNNEIVIPVEARSNGTSSVEIQLLTPVFDQPLGRPAVLEARVNALTGLGPMVTGFAALLLGSWWYSHFRRRRKQRLADETPVSGIALDEPLSPDAAEAAAGPPSGHDGTASLTDL